MKCSLSISAVLYILSKTCFVRSLSVSPVFNVVAGSKSITETSFSATGLCSVPFGTIKNSFLWITIVLSRSSIFKTPSSTKNISSSSSCLCQTNSPLNFASLTCCPLSSPTIFGLQYSENSFNFSAITTFSIYKYNQYTPKRSRSPFFTPVTSTPCRISPPFLPQPAHIC